MNRLTGAHRALKLTLITHCLHMALSASTQAMKLNIRFARYLRSTERRTSSHWVRWCAAKLHSYYLGVFMFLAKHHCGLAFRLDEIRRLCREKVSC